MGFAAKAAVRAIGIAVMLMLSACISTDNRQPAVRKLERFGIQLYTLRAEMAADFEGTLRKVAAQGYDEVEFAGLFGRDPAQVQTLLAALKLDPVSSHINWDDLRRDPARQIAQTKALGARYMVIAWFPPEDRDSIADWQDRIVFFNRVGAMAKAQGIQFVYHNHDFEFTAIGGIEPYEMLLTRLDPNLVKMELDHYWLAKAGRTPQPYFKRYPGQFVLSHVKDMSRTNTDMADVGQGRLDFPAIFAQDGTSGALHHFVEHDNAADPFATAASSIAYLKSLVF
jgi:sugar phosphate isomerase/epimerase